MDLAQHRQNISENGFTVIDDIFGIEEIEHVLAIINQADTTNLTFRKSADLFAIRQFLKEIPAIQKHIFTDKLKKIIAELFGQIIL